MLAQPLVKSTREFTVRAKMCRNWHVRKRLFGFLSGKDEFAAGGVPQLLEDRDSAIGQRHTVFTTGLHPSRNKPASMFSMPRPIRQMAGCSGEGPGACEGVGVGENGYV